MDLLYQKFSRPKLSNISCFGTGYLLIDIEGKTRTGQGVQRKETDIKVVKHKRNDSMCCFAFTIHDNTALKLFNGNLDIFCEFICLATFPCMTIKNSEAHKDEISWQKSHNYYLRSVFPVPFYITQFCFNITIYFYEYFNVINLKKRKQKYLTNGNVS